MAFGTIILAVTSAAIVACRHGACEPRTVRALTPHTPFRTSKPQCISSPESLQEELRAANAARQDAEERVDDLTAELNALQQLYSDEVAAREELEATLQNQGRADATGDTAELRELEQRLAAANKEVSSLRTELYRARADADDAGLELDAVRELASQEEQALRATIEELMEQLRAAEAGGPRSADEQEREDLVRIQLLEEQLGELLVAEEAARSELFQLRPKMAELEAKLAAAQGGAGEQGRSPSG